MHRKIFLDTNPIIYLLENRFPYATKVRDFIVNGLDAEAEFYTSTITDAEFLVRPYIVNDIKGISAYKGFLDDLNVLKCFITDEIAEIAARIRAKYPSIKLGDSIQLAASIDCNCDAFFTNDRQLKQVAEINCVLVDEL